MADTDTPLERESLRDLDGVRVVVQDPLPQAGQLRGAVEAKLRLAGIRVLNSGEYPTGDPFLRVRVSTTAESSGIVGYLIQLDFVQIVFLRRNPAVTFNRAQTWSASERMGLVSSPQLTEKIRQELADQTDQFIQAFFAVNPK